MGLDIYAGTLTRYYSHNWKTVVQQWAEENGYTFNRITPDGEPADNEEELSPAESQAAVEDWRDQILAAISQPNQPHYTPWPEDNERPYYTDKPDWDAFGAMLLVAACHTYEEPVPLTVEKDWDFGEHPLIARLASDEERVWSLLRGATWWLPLTDSFLFQGPLPTDDQTMIATLGGLRKQGKAKGREVTNDRFSYAPPFPVSLRFAPLPSRSLSACRRRPPSCRYGFL